jgi:hypothetical protein
MFVGQPPLQSGPLARRAFGEAVTLPRGDPEVVCPSTVSATCAAVREKAKRISNLEKIFMHI